MSTQTPAADRGPAQPLTSTNKDELSQNGAPHGHHTNGTFAPGNQSSWKHGAYSQQTQHALVEHPEAAAALRAHRHEIETDLGGDASRLKRDLVRRCVETAALADHLGWHLTTRGALTGKGHARAALSVYLQVLDRCFRHQLLLPRPYLVLTKPLRLDIQCQRGASVKIGWKYLDD